MERRLAGLERKAAPLAKDLSSSLHFHFLFISLAHLFLRPTGCWVVSVISAGERVRTEFNLSQRRRLFSSPQWNEIAVWLCVYFHLANLIFAIEEYIPVG